MFCGGTIYFYVPPASPAVVLLMVLFSSPFPSGCCPEMFPCCETAILAASAKFPPPELLNVSSWSELKLLFVCVFTRCVYTCGRCTPHPPRHPTTPARLLPGGWRHASCGVNSIHTAAVLVSLLAAINNDWGGQLSLPSRVNGCWALMTAASAEIVAKCFKQAWRAVNSASICINRKGQPFKEHDLLISPTIYLKFTPLIFPHIFSSLFVPSTLVPLCSHWLTVMTDAKNTSYFLKSPQKCQTEYCFAVKMQAALFIYPLSRESQQW